MVTVFFVIIFVGLLLRMRFGSGSHFPCLATNVRDYGFLLLVIPVLWASWGAWENNRPKVGLGDTGKIMLSGILVWVGLLAFGFVAAGTIPSPPLIHVIPQNEETRTPVAVREHSLPTTDAGR